MKRYINGRRMLVDLNNGKITSTEKLVYLIFILVPLGDIIDNYFKTAPTPLDSSAESFGYLITLAGMIVFLVVNKLIDDESLIERYCCLFVPATVTSYLFLIPFLLIFDKVVKNIFGTIVSEMAGDYLIAGYMSIYICLSMMLWKMKIEPKGNHV